METKREVVKQKTYELVERAKKNMNALVERAFLTGAFDIDYAFEHDYLIPQAIVNATLMSLASEYTNASPKEVNEEAENIFSFL